MPLFEKKAIILQNKFCDVSLRLRRKNEQVRFILRSTCTNIANCNYKCVQIGINEETNCNSNYTDTDAPTGHDGTERHQLAL